MMIVHVPADGSKATLISLPRDSYVDIPGYGMNKLNAAYPIGYNDASGSHNAKQARRRRPADQDDREPHRRCTSTTSSWST